MPAKPSITDLSAAVRTYNDRPGWLRRVVFRLDIRRHVTQISHHFGDWLCGFKLVLQHLPRILLSRDALCLRAGHKRLKPVLG